MTKKVVLDLFCGAGGASAGYKLAGCKVFGVDINPQPRYPFEFIQGDASDLNILKDILSYNEIDLIHASPPCQKYSKTQRINGIENYPDLIGKVRSNFQELDIPYVIENVRGAPLKHPIELCGLMFGLKTYRHRLFETSWPMVPIKHPEHWYRTAKMGRKPKPGEFIHVVGHFSGKKEAEEAMGIDWMSRAELAQAIPPAYTEYIGIKKFGNPNPNDISFAPNKYWGFDI